MCSCVCLVACWLFGVCVCLFVRLLVCGNRCVYVCLLVCVLVCLLLFVLLLLCLLIDLG